MKAGTELRSRQVRLTHTTQRGGLTLVEAHMDISTSEVGVRK